MEDTTPPNYQRKHAQGWHHYRALGLKPEATPEEIKLKYRKLALLFHPDKNPGSEDKFKAISEAYACLSDPVARAKYDLLGDVDYQHEQKTNNTSQKIEVEPEVLRREWGIWLGVALGGLILSWLTGFPLHWISVLGASLYSIKHFKVKKRVIGILVFFDLFLAVIIPLPLLAPMANLAVILAGTIYMNRLTVQIDPSAGTALFLSLLALSLPLVHETVFPKFSYIGQARYYAGLISPVLAANALTASVYALNRARDYFILMQDLLEVRHSILWPIRHLLYSLFSAPFLYSPLWLWSRHVLTLPVSRSGWIHIEWIFLFWYSLLLSIEHILAVVVSKEKNAIGKIFISALTGVGLFIASRYFPDYFPNWVLGIGVHAVLSAGVIIGIVRRYIKQYDPPSEDAKSRYGNLLTELVSGSLIVAVNTYHTFQSPIFSGNSMQSDSIRILYLPPLFLGVFSASLLFPYLIFDIFQPFSYYRKYYSRIMERISEWTKAGEANKEADSSSGGTNYRGFFGAATGNLGARWGSVAKSKAKEKYDPNYKSSREMKREAIKEQKRLQKKEKKISVMPNAIPRPVFARKAPRGHNRDSDSE